MDLDSASRGIGTGIGIAAMGIGLGIAFDSMRSLNQKANKKSYTLDYKIPKMPEFKGFKKYKW